MHPISFAKSVRVPGSPSICKIRVSGFSPRDATHRPCTSSLTPLDSGLISRTDFPGGSPSLLRKSIDELSQLDVEYLVPGHSTEMGNIIVGQDKVRRNFYTVKMFF